MPDSIREQIIKALKAQVELVTVANGYANTLQSVQRWNYRGQTTTSHPWTCLMEGDEEADDANNMQIGKKLTIELLTFAVQGETDARSSDEYLNSLAADIEKAIMANRMLGTLCDDITPIRRQQADIEVDQPELGLLQSFVIGYRHLMGNPAQII